VIALRSRSRAFAPWLLVLACALPRAASADLVFTSSPPLTAEVGQVYSYTIVVVDTTAADGSPPPSISAPTLPSWLAFDGVDTLSGTPEAADVGANGVVLEATLDGVTATQSYTIDVSPAPNNPPRLDSPIAPDPQTATEGQDYSLDVSPFFSDPDGDPLSFSAAGLPASLRIDDKGKISGKPDLGTASGSPYTVTVTASDGTESVGDSFTLNVLAANRPPRLDSPISPDPQNATEGVDYSFDVSPFFSDPDGDKLTFDASGLPNGLKADGNGKLSGKPQTGTAAGSPYSVTITASDGEQTASDAFTLIVAAPNRPPELDSPISPDPQNATEGDEYSFDVSPFFSDPDGDTLTFGASGLPSSLSIDFATGRIFGTLSAADAGSPSKAYSIDVTASDGSATASGGYTLNVAGVDEPPSLPDPPPRLSTPEDTPLTVTATMLNAQDEDPDSLTVVLSPPGSNAHFTLTGGGATVQPEANYNGALEVEARVKDAQSTSNAVTVTIDVTPVNDAPDIDPIPVQSATEGRPFSADIGGFVSDADGDPLTFRATGLPPGLTLDAVTGTLSGTPPLGTEAADYDAALRVNDGSATSSAKFTIRVLAAGRADLEASAEVSPNPALTGENATWTLGVDNKGTIEVGNVALEAVYSGKIPLRFGALDPACSLQQQGEETHISCSLGPLSGGESASVEIAASASQAGHIGVVVTVEITDPPPIDTVAENDVATAALDVTESLSETPAENFDAPGANGIATGDFNGDGRDDLAVATDAGPLVFLNGIDPNDENKLSFVSLPLSFTSPSGATDIAAADFDQDGDIDLAVASDTAPAGLLLNDGSAGFEEKTIAGGIAARRAVAAADVNGDGYPDVVFANDGADELYVNDGAGNFARMELAGSSRSVGVAAADLIGDALPELVFANADGGAVLYVNSAGSFDAGTTLDTGPTTSVAAEDFDGDAVLDLVFGQSTGTLPANPVYLNVSTSAPEFFPVAELGGVETVAVLADDFDMNGTGDVVTINAAGGHELYTNTGGANTQFLLSPQQFTTDGARAAVAGKFSGDDRLDVAVSGGDRVAIFFNDGLGNLGLGDLDAPTLSLNGDPTVTITVGDDYVDAGATASDSIDGDLTDQISVDNPVDTSVIGTYTVSYDVVDSSGNAAATLERTVDVQARQASGGGGGGGSLGLSLGLLAFAAMLARLRGLERSGHEARTAAGPGTSSRRVAAAPGTAPTRAATSRPATVASRHARPAISAAGAQR
jgi:hypothetical protein